jgi:hypothetical protein
MSTPTYAERQEQCRLKVVALIASCHRATAAVGASHNRNALQVLSRQLAKLAGPLAEIARDLETLAADEGATAAEREQVAAFRQQVADYRSQLGAAHAVLKLALRAPSGGRPMFRRSH